VEEDSRTSTLRDYLDVLWRRKWIVLQAAILVPAAAILASLREPELYQASATALVKAENLPANLEGVPDPTQISGTRIVKTQAELARVPAVGQKVVDELGLEGWSPSDVFGISSVVPGEESDTLTFSVAYGDPELAAQLATAYGEQFSVYRLEQDKAVLEELRSAAEMRLAELEASGETDSALYQSLAEQAQRIETLESIQTPRVELVRPATGAVQIQPEPMKNAMIGLVLGVLIGVGTAILWEALDPRVRTADAVTSRLRLPLLGRIPRPPRRLSKDQRLVMLDDPEGPEAEAFRILRTNFELACLQAGARSVMVTSGIEQEGKTTTVANLALALARAGRRVALLDLDLRSASIHRFFRIEAQPGLADVAFNRVRLSDALVRVDLGDQLLPTAMESPYGFSEGSLDILPSGSRPPNAGEFVARLPLGPILAYFQGQTDIVLIDGPPLLRVGDAIAVSSEVDALAVVARLNVARGPMLDDLGRVLRSSPTAKLGVIVAGANLERGYGYLTSPYQSSAGRPATEPFPSRPA
jgi:non-specific protein-tyrosine kinase